MNRFFYFTLLLFTNNLIKAQSISGFIKNQSSEPIPFATVIAFTDSVTKPIGFCYTDTIGFFSINLNEKKTVLIKISTIGFVDTTITFTTISSPQNMTIFLTSTSISLHTVEIKAKRALFEKRLDKIIFNVSESALASSSDALFAISKIPSVKTDIMGNISMQGKSNVMIYLDGRKIIMTSEQLSSFLKTINGSDILKIEIIKNPGASYEAEGQAGVINIITKKSLEQGFAGAIKSEYRQSTYAKTNNGVDLRFRKNKILLFTGVNYNNSQNLNTNINNINYTHSNNLTFSQENSTKTVTKEISPTVIANVEYTPTNRDKIYLLSNASQLIKNGHALTNGKIGYLELVSDTTIDNSNIANSKLKTATINSGWEHSFDSLATKKLIIDYAGFYSQKNETNTISLSQNSINLSQNSIYNSNALKQIALHTLNSTYVFTIKNTSIETGIKASVTENKSNFKLFQNINSVFLPVTDFINDFTYKETNLAGFISAQHPFSDKLNAMAGIRIEQTNYKGHSQIFNFTTNRNYIKPFPTLNVQYTPNEKNDFIISYSRRINRPMYNQLSVFRNFITPYLVSQGNPQLLPSLSDNIELSYTFNQIYTITAYRYFTQNSFIQARIVSDVNNVAVLQTINTDKSIYTGANIYIPIKISNIYNLTMYADASQQTESSKYLTGSYNYNLFIYSFNVSNQFVFNKTKGFMGEINFDYSSPYRQAVFKVNSMYNLSLSLKKMFFKNKLSVVLSVDDILYSSIYVGKINLENQTAELKYLNDSRMLLLNLKYNFGSSSVKKSSEKRMNAIDEINRAK